MKKNHVFTYLFMFFVCFIVMGSKVLAKDTVCVYDVSAKKYLDSGEARAQDYRFAITVSDSKFEVNQLQIKEGVITPNTTFYTDVIKKESFIKSDKTTNCPTELMVTVDASVMLGSYFNHAFVSTSEITDEQYESLEKKYKLKRSNRSQVFIASNVPSLNENVGEQTKIEGGVSDNLNPVRPTTGIKVVGCSIFGEKTLPIVKTAFRLIRLGIPILIVIMGTIDFLGVVFSGEEKNFKEAGQKFVKRVVAGVIFVFIPYFLTFLINISGVMEDYDLKTDELFCVFGGADQIVTENDTVEENKTEQNNNVTTPGNNGSSNSDSQSSSGRQHSDSSGEF